MPRSKTEPDEKAGSKRVSSSVSVRRDVLSKINMLADLHRLNKQTLLEVAVEHFESLSKEKRRALIDRDEPALA